MIIPFYILYSFYHSAFLYRPDVRSGVSHVVEQDSGRTSHYLFLFSYCNSVRFPELCSVKVV